MTYEYFLNIDELRELTGFSSKSRQIIQLRTMGIPFHVNGYGKPVVTRSSVEGKKTEQYPIPQRLAWQSTMMQQDKKAA
jgi:hypothetical protein